MKNERKKIVSLCVTSLFIINKKKIGEWEMSTMCEKTKKTMRNSFF